jgi:hypothetical protein
MKLDFFIAFLFYKINAAMLVEVTLALILEMICFTYAYTGKRFYEHPNTIISFTHFLNTRSSSHNDNSSLARILRRLRFRRASSSSLNDIENKNHSNTFHTFEFQCNQSRNFVHIPCRLLWESNSCTVRDCIHNKIRQ